MDEIDTNKLKLFGDIANELNELKKIRLGIFRPSCDIYYETNYVRSFKTEGLVCDIEYSRHLNVSDIMVALDYARSHHSVELVSWIDASKQKLYIVENEFHAGVEKQLKEWTEAEKNKMESGDASDPAREIAELRLEEHKKSAFKYKEVAKQTIK